MADIPCTFAGCQESFETFQEFAQHVLDAHNQRDLRLAPAPAAAEASRVKATRPTIERNSRPSDWDLFVLLLDNYFLDSRVTTEDMKKRQLLNCVPKDIQREVSIKMTPQQTFKQSLLAVRTLLVPKIPETQLRHEAMARKQAEGEPFRVYVAKVQTAFAGVRYVARPGQDITDAVIKDIVIMGARNNEDRDQVFRLDNIDDLDLEQVTE